MDEFNKQYQDALSKIIIALANDKNVIICGPGKSGKTRLQYEVRNILDKKNYDVFYGVPEYNYSKKINGQTYSANKFWIEETKKEILGSMYDEYDYIELPLVYPN